MLSSSFTAKIPPARLRGLIIAYSLLLAISVLSLLLRLACCTSGALRHGDGIRKLSRSGWKLKWPKLTRRIPPLGASPRRYREAHLRFQGLLCRARPPALCPRDEC